MQNLMESGQKISTFCSSKVIFCAFLGFKNPGWRGWLGWRDLPFFFAAGGWRLTLRVKFRGWRGAARLAETSTIYW
jgi:hypothetical protein